MSSYDSEVEMFVFLSASLDVSVGPVPSLFELGGKRTLMLLTSFVVSGSK